ncbi:hypothetical protein EBR61_02885 [bacterium]|nr:hypothetical protein [bacterium]
MSFFNNYIYGSNEYLGRLYLIVSSLITFGLITLYSISSDPLSISSSFMRQLIFIVFSLFVFDVPLHIFSANAMSSLVIRSVIFLPQVQLYLNFFWNCFGKIL